MGPKFKKIAGQKLSVEMSSAIETLLKKKEVSLEVKKYSFSNLKLFYQ